MRRFLARRLLQSVLLLWVLMTFTFCLTRLAPGGPESMLLEQPKIQKVDLDRIRARFGLDDPLPLAYAKWLGNVLRLDFGMSYHYLRPPLEVIGERMWATVQLGALAYAIALIGIPLGVAAALNRGRLPDISIRVFTVMSDAVPNWWMALVIIVALSTFAGWVPRGQGTEGPLDWFRHIIIPAAILGLGGIVGFTRYVRSQVLEVIGQDYVRTARAKGLTELAVARDHILRNALLPLVTIFGGLLPALISGAALMEVIFAWPGMGRLYLDAALSRDYPLLLAMITIATIATLLGTLSADVMYGYVDPRIRYS
ncbi:MAG: transporter permease [Chloroflexi bacterium]|nr:transporter permease [Chloroflexota bacterium]